MNRLANIDARRHQVSGLSHVSTNPLEILASGDIVDTDVDDDDYYDEMNDSNSYDDGNHCYDEDGRDDISCSEDADMNSGNGEDSDMNSGYGEDSINEEDDSDDNEDDIDDN
ncbi:hypothetical protein PVAP13_3NG148506 [Panicum virgatum]|uniref:Uncharacterized protein n=2 Tax=Panicum virgatum TaxID=38727 RepID=A0A8T0UAM5_PANVG|nr:hypothetical protein PVAP13_3NG148506 [Panicum virgatum]